MIKPGDRLYKLFERVHAYEVRMPGPPTLVHMENHIEQLASTPGGERIVDGLDIVELEVVSVRRARDTEPCGPPEPEYRAEQETLPDLGGKAAE